MKTGFACGVFDLFHAGHVLMLKECKEHCDYLIVALNEATHFSETVNPGKRKPIYSIEERKLIVGSCKYVDEVLTYSTEEELYDIMKTEKINIRFLGTDYADREITGSDLGIELYYTNRDHGYSSTKIINEIIKRDEK
jgi:glycerol-3-phosphate cytidylyltransferase